MQFISVKIQPQSRPSARLQNPLGLIDFKHSFLAEHVNVLDVKTAGLHLLYDPGELGQ